MSHTGDGSSPAKEDFVGGRLLLQALQVTVAFNQVECEVATAHHATCVDLLHPFNGPKGTTWPGELIGPDGTHPSAAGHEEIAGLLEAAGVDPLA